MGILRGSWLLWSGFRAPLYILKLNYFGGPFDLNLPRNKILLCISRPCCERHILRHSASEIEHNGRAKDASPCSLSSTCAHEHAEHTDGSTVTQNVQPSLIDRTVRRLLWACNGGLTYGCCWGNDLLLSIVQPSKLPRLAQPKNQVDGIRTQYQLPRL